MKIPNSKKGFTLIEILAYSGIVTIFVAAAVLASYGMIDYSGRVQKQLEVNENRQFLVQKIGWILQNNSTINSPASGSSGSSLSVNKLNFGNNPLIVNSSNGKVWLTAGGSPVNLTSDRVTIGNLTFEHQVFSSISAIKVSGTVLNDVASTTIDTTFYVKQ